MRLITKIICYVGATAVLALGIFIYFKFYFPVASEAVKSGELNYIMYKGYIWKTYEGKLIQAGLKSRTGAGVQSNEFEFSVEDKALAQELMRNSGHIMSLRYKQYNGILPWRGMQRNIVYAIDRIEPINNSLRGNDFRDVSEAAGVSGSEYAE